MDVGHRMRNVSKRFGLLSLIVGGLCATALCQYAAEFSSYHAGNRYDSRITHDELAKTPLWHDNAPNPPCSPRQAKLAAAKYLKQLFSDADKWTLDEIALHPVADRWVYTISFTEPAPLGVADPFSSPFRVVVRMDGVAVVATVSRYTATQLASDAQKRLVDAAQARCLAWRYELTSQFPPQGGCCSKADVAAYLEEEKQLDGVQARCAKLMEEIEFPPQRY